MRESEPDGASAAAGRVFNGNGFVIRLLLYSMRSPNLWSFAGKA